MTFQHSPLSLRAALRTREVRAGLGVILVVALALTGLYVVRSSHASGFTVCASGCTYTSINAAITAASSGATITVGPGTYGPATSDNPIVITKPLTLTGAGVGQSIINDVTAYQASAANSGMVQVTNPGGNVTISGFTMTGAIANDAASCCDDGHFIVATDTNAADTMTFSDNLFYEDTLLDGQLLGDQLDAILVNNSTVATTTITGNTFQGIFRAALFSEGGGDGPVNFTNNTLNGLHGLYDITTNPPTLYYWPEGVFFLSDNTTNQTAAHVITGNTFENYAGLALGFDAGYPGGLIGSISNFTITGNTFNVGGVTGAPGGSGESEIITMHAFGTTNGTVTSTISNMSIQNNVFNEASATGDGYGINIKGDVTTGISIANNAIHGSGTAPLAGVNVVCDDTSTPDPCSATTQPGISITNNLITGYQKGVASDTLPAGTSLSASQNCIFGNTTDGAFSSDSGNTGAQITAQQNWWGAATGPNTAGADNVAGNIDSSSFLTAAAPACQGPVGSAIAATPAHVLVGNTFALTASLSDASTGGVAIASAQWSRDGGPYSAMSAQDGTFDQVTEAVTASVPGIATPGAHTFCVRGTDSQGNQGTPVCAPITVYTPDTVGLRASATNTVYLRNSNTTGITNTHLTYGTAGDVPLAGDWTGKGYDSVGTYQSATSTFYLRNTNTTGPADITVLFGAPGDIPVVGDWNGDGVDTIGVWNPTTHRFSLRNSNSAGPADITLLYGASGDIPVVGDWTGKGYDSVGVFRPSNNRYLLRNTNTTGGADISAIYGAAGDKPIVGDWVDQGKTTIGVYRPSTSTFYLRNSNTTGGADIVFTFNPTSGGTPFVGRWTTAGLYLPPRRSGSQPAADGGAPRLKKGAE
ncbi:MAG TPA: hypothetical protein VIG30_08370 [Ktedonobacterales bacterium]